MMNIVELLKANVGKVVSEKRSGDMGRIVEVKDGSLPVVVIKSYGKTFTITTLEFKYDWTIEFSN